jgi:hypothetical protein
MLNERRSHIVPVHKKLLSKLRGEVSQSVAQFVMRVKGKRSRSLDERVGDLPLIEKDNCNFRDADNTGIGGFDRRWERPNTNRLRQSV